MPTYSYACNDCGHTFDQYQAFSEDSLTVCPQCGDTALRKVFSNIGVTFNGSGFYRTDSRAGSKTDAAAPKTPAPAASKPAPAAPAAPAASTTSSSSSSST